MDRHPRKQGSGEVELCTHASTKPWLKTALTSLQASIAGVVTFIIALYISKIGVLAFLGRITKNRTQILGYYACCALVAIFGVMSILIVTVGCSSPSGYYWAFYENSARCDSQVRRITSLRYLYIKTDIDCHSLSAGKCSQLWTSSPSLGCSHFPFSLFGACRCHG
jgi:hypothetical protein